MTRDNLTLIYEDKIIRCSKDYKNLFYRDSTYRFSLYKHNETNLNVYAVYTDSPDDFETDIFETDSYFVEKSFSEYFDTVSFHREEKLNNLGI